MDRSESRTATITQFDRIGAHAIALAQWDTGDPSAAGEIVAHALVEDADTLHLDDVAVLCAVRRRALEWAAAHRAAGSAARSATMPIS